MGTIDVDERTRIAMFDGAGAVKVGMTPPVSILMPAWNAAPTMTPALSSILRQTSREWECVVVDDGSTDGTPAIVQAVAAADSRVRYVATRHAGLVAALNA